MASRPATTVSSLFGGNFQTFVFIPPTKPAPVSIKTLKGEIPPSEYKSETYVVSKTTFERDFYKKIEDEGLWFEDIKRHVDTAKLATELGIKASDINYVYSREEADGFPFHPTARMSQSYSQGWMKHDPSRDHSRITGSIIVQLKNPALLKYPHLKLHTAAEITEW
jgi:hypothetical protein